MLVEQDDARAEPLDELEAVAPLLEKLPIRYLIDHFGRVDGRLGVDQPAFRLLLDLAGEGNVYVKISGADRLMARGSPYENVVALARALIARAPDRIVWGTDWPHSNVFEPNKTPNDGDLMNLLALAAPSGLAALPGILDAARLAQARITRDLRIQARGAIEGFLQGVLDAPVNAARARYGQCCGNSYRCRRQIIGQKGALRLQ